MTLINPSIVTDAISLPEPGQTSRIQLPTQVHYEDSLYQRYQNLLAKREKVSAQIEGFKKSGCLTDGRYHQAMTEKNEIFGALQQIEDLFREFEKSGVATGRFSIGPKQLMVAGESLKPNAQMGMVEMADAQGFPMIPAEAGGLFQCGEPQDDLRTAPATRTSQGGRASDYKISASGDQIVEMYQLVQVSAKSYLGSIDRFQEQLGKALKKGVSEEMIAAAENANSESYWTDLIPYSLLAILGTPVGVQATSKALPSLIEGGAKVLPFVRAAGSQALRRASAFLFFLEFGMNQQGDEIQA
ncbi:MAG: hypothetical protein KDK66_07545 [Deltaproteobacteria bacterium]|nr:hypothetical protein [Deltaproteobacteria bacterium]